MKGIYVIIILFLSVSNSYSQVIDWDAVIDRYIEKYQPEKIPQWIFPIIFKNGIGDQDTIYFNYDPEADGFLQLDFEKEGFITNHDTIYGQKYMAIDTSTFKACIDECRWQDSVLYALDTYTNPLTYDVQTNISFNKGILPIRAYFNSSLFRSDSLPQVSPPGFPHFQGELWQHSIGIRIGTWDETLDEWEHFCVFDAPVILSDTVASWYEDCAFSDSLYIGDIPDNLEFTEVGSVELNIQQWSGIWVNTQEAEALNFSIYPNPVKDHLIVEFDQNTNGQWYIYAPSGQLINTKRYSNAQQITIQSPVLISGIYFLVVQHGQNIYSHTFVVLP